ncbi:major facilitator superfamily domain-containing protein [Cercophora newfieldiana]|uniref:Major facilitator superfamily domain-containing protein n=1 Tax=Cercophora newfieldiana TaxID=92897 RepID=A0AA40CNK0_9PEZI|nr:major facilitator superfamily domain-containing protein [Cercophora newfieldiana]
MAEVGVEKREDEPNITADSSRASQLTMEKAGAAEASSQEGHSSVPGPSNSDSVHDGEHTTLELPIPRLIILCAAVCLGFFLALLDTSIVATSLHVISTEFNETNTIFWVALSYTLAYLSCAVLFARISDVIGRRAAVMTAYVIFIAFSLACGWSKNITQLIAFRALQGVGGSGLYSLTMIILPEAAPMKYQGVVTGLIGIVLAAAGVLGPLIGGLLTEYASWRWVFWINGPVGGVSAVVFFCVWPDAKYLPPFHARKWKEVDFFGAFLLIAAATLIVFPFQNSGVEGGNWSSPKFIAPLVFGILALAAVFLWQWYAERRWEGKLAATLPIVLLRNRAYSTAAFHACLTGFAYFVAIYAFPMRFQVVNGKNPFEAGLMLLPMLAATAVGSVLAGAANKKDYRFSETLAVACALMMLGCALETTAGTGVAIEAKVLGFLVFIGIGFGLSAAGETMLGIEESPAREHATAQGIIAQVRVLGGSIGIAASSAILSVRSSSAAGGAVNAQLLLHSGLHGLSPEQQEVVRRIYTLALRDDMIVCASLLGLGVLISGLAYRKDRRLRAQRMTDEKERIQAGEAGGEAQGGVVKAEV